MYRMCVVPRSQRVTLDASSGEDEDKFMRTLLQVCQLGDFKSDDDKKDTVAKCLARIADAKEPKITAALVRVEDDKEKETPLHKLARAKVRSGRRSRAHTTLAAAMLSACADACGPDPFAHGAHCQQVSARPRARFAAWARCLDCFEATLVRSHTSQRLPPTLPLRVPVPLRARSAIE